MAPTRCCGGAQHAPPSPRSGCVEQISGAEVSAGGVSFDDAGRRSHRGSPESNASYTPRSGRAKARSTGTAGFAGTAISGRSVHRGKGRAQEGDRVAHPGVGLHVGYSMRLLPLVGRTASRRTQKRKSTPCGPAFSGTRRDLTGPGGGGVGTERGLNPSLDCAGVRRPRADPRVSGGPRGRPLLPRARRQSSRSCPRPYAPAPSCR